MANRVVNPNLFAPNPPNWSLVQLDANASNAVNAINDSSLGFVNGPLADTGSANNYQVACNYGTPSALNNGMTVFFTPANTNTGASTLTVSPLSSAPIVSTSSTALVGGELAAGTTIGVVYDGTQFRILNLPSPASIYSVRLRSFNSVGNPNFEVNQRSPGTALTLGTGTSAGFPCDRWSVGKVGATMTLAAQLTNTGASAVVPGTSYRISSQYLTIGLTAQQASLAAGDYISIYQYVEGPFLRELFNDVHSVSLLVQCTSALTFSLALKDFAATKTLTKLCQITTPNTWQLISLPSLPAWPAGNFSILPGNVGYQFTIGLAAGATFTSPANDTWQSGSFICGPGTTNFASLPVNTNLLILMVQHEPGAVCTTFQDLDFDTNLSRCLRYFTKSYNYTVVPGTITSIGNLKQIMFGANNPILPCAFQRRMAKIPTVYAYSDVTGTGNAVRDNTAAADKAITSVQTVGETGFAGFVITSPNASNYNCSFQYTADTGW